MNLKNNQLKRKGISSCKKDIKVRIRKCDISNPVKNIKESGNIDKSEINDNSSEYKDDINDLKIKT